MKDKTLGAWRWTAWALPLAAAMSAPAQAQSPAAPSRGQLLYETHCIACHTTQMHWRDQRRAVDWDSLQALVRYWQLQAQLGWSEADVDAVARHLNETIYRFPLASRRASRPTEPQPPGGSG